MKFDPGWALLELVPIPPKHVVAAVAHAFGTTPEHIRAKDRSDRIVCVARMVAALLLVDLCEISSRQAGIEINRDAGYVRGVDRRLPGYRRAYPKLDSVIETLRKKLRSEVRSKR